MFVGTKYYIAPELTNISESRIEQSFLPVADVYSLGISLTQLCRSSRISRNLRSLIKAMCCKNPE
jgi:serine/threonine protein kinase